MTSLIFWVPYTAHHVWNERRREKQRVRNYERWEGLRDEYDEQRRTQSLDLQRTGTGVGGWEQQPGDAPRSSIDGYSYPNASRPILTLRDQQEASDARLSWRPQEAWDGPRTQLQAQMTGQQPPSAPGQGQHPYDVQRHASASPAVPAYMQPQQTGSVHSLPLRAQKTGATWDEGLPARLRVARRSYEEDDYSHRYRSASGTATGTPATGVSRQSSLGRDGGRDSGPSLGGNNARTHTPSGLSRETTTQYEPNRRSPEIQVTQVIELPKNEFGFVEPVAAMAPGGRMAEILERGY